LSRPVFLSFQNEPESHVGTDGSAQDYVRAWRHIHDRFAVAGVTNVVWLWNVIGANSGTMHALVRALYPGNAYVDWVAWDPYNWAGCRGEPWRDFAGIVKPFYDWLVGNGFGGKPFMLAEYGSVEDPANPSAKADWFSGEAKTLATGEFPKLKAMIYFDHPAPPASCDWRISTSTASVAAYRDLATSTARD
jgi:beta-mannanase